MSILLTGVTGFLGKVLFWKILEEDKFDHIYVLIRTKRNMDPKDRLLKLAMGRDVSKVHVLPYDLSELTADKIPDEIVDSITHIVHSAASVSFNNPFLKEYQENVTNTMNLFYSVVERCKKNLQIFVHVSTAFVQPRDSLNTLKYKTNDIIYTNDHHFDTYTQTKNICEHMLLYHCAQNRIPLKIVRPSIIGPSIRFPYKGFVDNYLAATGIMVLYKQGILKIANKCIDINIVPVDTVVEGILFSLSMKSSDLIIPCVSPFTLTAKDIRKHIDIIFVDPIVYRKTSMLIDHSKLHVFKLFDKKKANSILNAVHYIIDRYGLTKYAFIEGTFQSGIEKDEYINNCFFPGIFAFMNRDKKEKFVMASKRRIA